MDVDETLKELRRMSAKRNNDPESFDSVDAAIMCELFDALDGWLTKGGFLPSEWRLVNGE